MWLLVLFIVVAVPVAVGIALWARGARARREAARVGSSPPVTSRTDMPAPGDPPPRRDGDPVPGSREDRARHGKP